MKKILILFTALYFFSLQNATAEEKFAYENTTWNVIRERLFGGSNSNVFRYEDNIRIQLKGSPNKQDSTIINDLIEELNSLMEIVVVKLVENESNFTLTFSPPNSGISTSYWFAGSKIAKTQIDFGFGKNDSHEQKVNIIYYHVFRHLTKLHEPRLGHTGYGGIFDSEEPENAEIHAIDKEIIRKIYSENFYRDLKRNTIAHNNYLYYLYLRYEKQLKFTSTILGIIISIFGFFLLFSSKLYSSSSNSLKDYFKIGYTAIFWISLASWFFGVLSKANILLYATVPIVSFFAILSAYCAIGFIAIPLLFVIENYSRKKFSDFLKRQSVVFLSTIFSVYLALFIFTNLLNVLNKVFSNDPFLSSLISQNRFNFIFFVSIVFMAGLRVFFNFLNYRLQSMVNQKDVELARMKELKNQAELNALHSRINPHFLYNSLNSIAGLAHADPDKTEKMATSLSSLFRYSINKEEKTYATVNEELEMVQKYLDVEKVRFGEKLDYSIDTDKETAEKQIPKFIIQPLVENAIKHGLSNITGAGKLKIEIKKEINDLVIRVYDNGPDFPDEPVKGYGLQNLHDKLQILYGDEAVLNWENGKNKNIQVTLKNQF